MATVALQVAFLLDALAARSVVHASARGPQPFAWARPLAGEDALARLGTAVSWTDRFGSLGAALRDSDSWQRRPAVIDCDVCSGAEGFFTWDDLRKAVDTDFLDAGRGVYDESSPDGWQMARVGTPRGQSFEDARLLFSEVEASLAKGTVVFNSFGANDATLAQFCLGAVEGLGLPANLNLYCTAPGRALSAPPHTDKQDVVIFQTQGAKRWQVFAPPEPSALPGVDPFARGKGKDRLERSELASPLVETVLEAGQVLYVPAGYPHTTSTEGVDSTESSIHLTLNVDTHIWGLNFEFGRRLALSRAGLADGLEPTALPLDQYLWLQDALFVGMLDEPQQEPGATPEERIAAGLAQRMVALEPDRWKKPTPAAIAKDLRLNEVAARLRRHHEALIDVQRRLYLDAALGLTPTPKGVSFFRVQPYLQELEAAMEAVKSWGAMASGGSAPRPTPGKGGKKKAGRRPAGKGFG